MLRVLVVEDSEDIARAEADLLGLWGYDVRVSSDGASALEVAARFRPQVILLDICMPQMDGYEVARRLRLQEASARAIIICISGYTGDDSRRLAKEAGCDSFLARPAEAVELQRMLESCSPLGG